ncbi:MAG: hypothetical protein IPN36_13615 [Bacteroidetes bacterium]|nr:hypothetical protein [Bacteroidota bacterium]
MLEIIITLLLALGIELNDESNVNVVDQQTGISYGVGTTLGNGQSVCPSNHLCSHAGC